MSLFRPERRDPSGGITPEDFIHSRRINGNGFAKPIVTPDSSKQKVAVFAATNLIASVTSMLPMDRFTGSGASKREVPLGPLLTDPEGYGYGRPDFVYQLVMSWLLRGNAFGQVLNRDQHGYPTQIRMLNPDTVRCRLDHITGEPVWTANGVEIPTADLWHTRAYPTTGELLGQSPIALHADTIGIGLSAQRYGASWFNDGGHPSSILSTDSPVDQDQAKTIKERFLAATRGNREPAVLGAGLKWTQIQINPAESQFLETQKYTAAECARIYGPGLPEMLGYETGGSMTYTNVEQRGIDLLTYTLDQWFTKVETVLTALTPGPQYVKINRKALLRTSTLDRFKAHAMALQNQWTVVNEVREIEDLGPVPWGDKPNVLAKPALPVAHDEPAEGPTPGSAS